MAWVTRVVRVAWGLKDRIAQITRVPRVARVVWVARVVRFSACCNVDVSASKTGVGGAILGWWAEWLRAVVGWIAYVVYVVLQPGVSRRDLARYDTVREVSLGLMIGCCGTLEAYYAATLVTKRNRTQNRFARKVVNCIISTVSVSVDSNCLYLGGYWEWK
jgi:hypothetical protein